MKIKIEPTEVVVTLTLAPVEADLLMRRAELAHEHFEGSSTDWNVMKELAEGLRKGLLKVIREAP